MVRLPKLPDLENMLSVIDKAGDAIDSGLRIIDTVADKFEQAAQKFGPPEPTTPETSKEPSPSQDEYIRITGIDICGHGVSALLPRPSVCNLISPIRGNKVRPGTRV